MYHVRAQVIVLVCGLAAMIGTSLTFAILHDKHMSRMLSAQEDALKVHFLGVIEAVNENRSVLNRDIASRAVQIQILAQLDRLERRIDTINDNRAWVPQYRGPSHKRPGAGKH